MIKVKKIMPLKVHSYGIHQGEEPHIVGNHRAGMVVFSGCHLSCSFCYTPEASKGFEGNDLTQDEFLMSLKKLASEGAESFHFITPTHLWPSLRKVFEFDLNSDIQIMGAGKTKVLKLSGFQTIDELAEMKKYAQVLVLDYKFTKSEYAKEYQVPGNYPKRAWEGIVFLNNKMKYKILKKEEKTYLKQGYLIRHLLMPNRFDQAKNILDQLQELNYFHGFLNFMTNFYDGNKKCLITQSKSELIKLISKYPKIEHRVLINGNFVRGVF